jgi:hypothetical protein
VIFEGLLALEMGYVPMGFSMSEGSTTYSLGGVDSGVVDRDADGGETENSKCEFYTFTKKIVY